MWLEILVAKLATNFKDLVAKAKILVALAPVLGAILRPAVFINDSKEILFFRLCANHPHKPHNFVLEFQTGGGSYMGFRKSS